MEFNDAILKTALAETRTIAVVGLSPDPMKTSYRVSKYMQEAGYEIIPVHPSRAVILGQKAFGTLGEIEKPVDMICIFRNSQAVEPFIDEAMALAPKTIWLPLGVGCPTKIATCEEKGIQYISNRCLMVEHARLI
ncbi:MAG: CoA-binding protein [Solirubrobacterales bacterium]